MYYILNLRHPSEFTVDLFMKFYNKIKSIMINGMYNL